MVRRILIPLVIGPGGVLVLVPAVLLYLLPGARWGPTVTPFSGLFVVAFGIGLLGGAIAIWSTGVFLRWGGGSPAPWDPPKTFVVRGPYRYVRNPMMLGLLGILLAEVLLTRSWAVLGWTAVVMLGMGVYIPTVDERALARRFGAVFRRYRQHVPRWIPRRHPWTPQEGDLAAEEERR